jgi:hypothetical protein
VDIDTSQVDGMSLNNIRVLARANESVLVIPCQIPDNSYVEALGLKIK